MIFLSAPSRRVSRSSCTPAIMDTKILSDAAMGAASDCATPSIICGLTPRNTNLLPLRISSGAAAWQPSRSAAAALCAGLLQATATCSPVTCRAAADASAPPILPAPIKPASYFIMVLPPQRICPSPRIIYL